jgi:NADPH:quinone reductase-like Zn-dependent oxidoreductase
MSQIILTGVGDPASNLRLADPELKVGAEDVLLRMEAAPVNPVEYLFSNGWYGVPPRISEPIGSEGVGRVAEVGTAADQSLAGKRVVVLGNYEQGVWGDTVVVPAHNVVVVPEGIDGLQLAMSVVNPVTAYLLLNNYVELKPGDWIGQTLGNSTVARAVYALARLAGIRTLSVVRTEKAAAEAREAGGDVVLVDGEDLADRVVEALGGAQLRLVLDGEGNTTAGALAGVTEPGGAIVAYSSTTNELPQLPLGPFVYGGQSLHGFWVVNWFATAGREEIERVVGEVVDLVGRGVLTVPVDSTFDFTRYEEALARQVSPERTGKVLLTFGDQA